MTDQPAFAPASPAAAPCPYAFTPIVSRLPRHDGWTEERQRRFIAALAVMGSVGRAVRAVGLSSASVYALRKRPGAESFAAAWDRALGEGRDRAFDVAMDRAINGYWTPRYYRGKVVGHLHRYDTTMALAALRAPKR